MYICLVWIRENNSNALSTKCWPVEWIENGRSVEWWHDPQGWRNESRVSDVVKDLRSEDKDLKSKDLKSKDKNLSSKDKDL